MRHSSCKRLLALVLCAMLMLCNMSFSAFADTESGEPTETENPEVPAPAEEPVEEPAEEPLEEAEGEIPSEDEEPVLTIIPEEDELPILLNTYLYVGETAVNADNEDDVLGDGNVVFDSTTNTLTFKVNKPTITGLHDGALIDALDLETLTVEAPSGLTLKSSGSRGISVPKGDLTVNGNLNVSLNGGSGEACVYTGLGLTVNGNLSTDCYGVTDAYGVKAMNGPVTITGTAEVIVEEVGIYCGSGDVTIGGAAYFGVNSQATLGFCPASCIYTAAGGVNLKSFSLEIGVAAYGIFANGPVYIGSALNFSNTGGMAGGYGIRSTSGGIVIDGGANMKVGSGCECLNSGDAPEGIVINGSAVLENGFSEVSLAVITAAGGPITVKGDLKATGYGVYAVSAKGDITVEGGATVDARTYNVSGRNTMAMISEQGSIKVSGNLKATGTGAGVYACQDITVGGDATVGTSVQTERDYIIKAETGELAVTGSLTTTGLAPVSAFGGAGITAGNNVTITNAAEDAIGMYSDGAITFVTGIWDVTAGKAETGEDGAETVTGGRQAILAKGGIEIA